MSRRLKSVAVLGGSRFIGLAIVEALLAKGCRVLTVNRGVTPVRCSSPVERVTADRRDPAGYARALAGIDVEAVVDVTAYRPEETRVVVASFGGRIGRLVHISSLSVYRWPLPCPVQEDAPLEDDPRHEYGYGKAACERLLFSQPTERLPWTALRLPAVFGPHDPHSREAYLLRQILKDKTIVVPPRPYLCQNLVAADAARAVCALLESPHAVGRAYNAGDEPFTLEGYVGLIAGLVGRPARMVRASTRVLVRDGAHPERIPYYFEGDVVLDTRRIRDEIGFSPLRPVEEAMAATVEEITRAPGGIDSAGWGLPWEAPFPAGPLDLFRNSGSQAPDSP
ncbi:NAD-dependent epimerase/dehydratase family protein [Desulfatitalea tepidiphila]|uniref:NAD-dependent epimerase/dehydratase family protein n=1 Tax=Desulfatitalea tepidiphila TaxID=1185843 RepID=UPI0006B5CF0B|nr:NAD-dependent epimerase/dehydratase family protein [Desulfatitalea tepidiphila]